MNVNLRKVFNNEDIDLFSKYKVILIKFHQKYANELGLIDKVVEKYDVAKAMKYIGKDGYYQYIIEYEDKDVGFVEYKIDISEIDNEKITEIKNIYIEDKYRNLGIAKDTIVKIREKTNNRIELECWYGIPANTIYKSLGMKELKTRYIMK